MLAALYVNNAARRRRERPDLLPWDFEKFNDVHKRWLRFHHERYKALEGVREAYEALPEAKKERVRKATTVKRVAKRIEDVPTIVWEPDYAALLENIEALRLLLDLWFDEEDALIALLMSEP